MKKFCLLFFAWALLMLPVCAQNIGINTDASKPDANAILDIKSGSKGLLIPRMSTEARNRIPNTKGLLVYDNTTDHFWYNTGREWRCIPHDDGGHGQNGDAWLIKGNSNTKDKINFFGTTNDVPLNIRVNNQPSGRIDSAKGTTFWGYKAGGADTAINNTAIGYNALKSNVTGDGNAANGYQCLFSNTSGEFNVANGFQALYSNTYGFGNVAAGYLALFSNTSGTVNVASGAFTLRNNTTGSENTGVGSYTLSTNTTGGQNTAIGTSAMERAGVGSGNVGIGYWTLYATDSGNDNTAVGTGAMLPHRSGNANAAYGYNALYNNYTGSNNTALGAVADVSTDGLTNATAVGYGAIVDASNKVRIGNAAVTVIEGQVPFTTPSDGRYKFNVQEDVKGLNFILALRPVTYQFDVKRFDRLGGRVDRQTDYVLQTAYDEASRIRRSGFIAQEVERAAVATGYDFSGIIRPKTEQDHYSLSYDAFVVPLVKAIQEQELRIAGLEAQIEELKKMVRAGK